MIEESASSPASCSAPEKENDMKNIADMLGYVP